MASTLEEIRKDWAVLEADVMAGVRKNNANDSQEEICDFLLVKFDRYTLHDDSSCYAADSLQLRKDSGGRERRAEKSRLL